MEAENLVFDDSSQGQVIEQLSELLPDVGVTVLPQALVVEAVDLGDLSRLVIASQDRDTVLEAHLERDEKSDRLDTVVTAIDIVTHEVVVRIRGLPANLEKLTQIVELSVDVTANGDWRFHLLDIRLIDEDLLGLVTEDLDLTFR